MNLTSPKTVKELLEKYSLKPQKGFGQNFLINPEIPYRIAMSSAFDNDGVGVLEIGPGVGAMTRELSALFEKVLAVEIDRGLIPLLSETLADCDNVTVINEDFLKLSLPELLREHFGERPVRICANLPYYITTPIIMSVLEAYRPSEKPQVQSVTVLVQSEVADRLCAEAGSDEYGAVTAAVNLSGRAVKLFTVSAGNFYPAPKVTSAVVRIELYENGIRGAFPGLPEDDRELDSFIEKVKKVISAAFLQRRKTLTNALSSLYPKEKTAAAFEKMGWRADVRGEKLSAADYIELTGLLQNNEN